jgi:hypothetical protein
MPTQPAHYLLVHPPPDRGDVESVVNIQGPDSPLLIFHHEAAIPLNIRTEDGSKFAFYFLGSHGVSPKNSIKGGKKIRLLRRFFTPMLKKNYSFSIKMSIRIKRLSFEMLYCKPKSKNEEFRKKLISHLIVCMVKS